MKDFNTVQYALAALTMAELQAQADLQLSITLARMPYVRPVYRHVRALTTVAGTKAMLGRVPYVWPLVRRARQYTSVGGVKKLIARVPYMRRLVEIARRIGKRQI